MTAKAIVTNYEISHMNPAERIAYYQSQIEVAQRVPPLRGAVLFAVDDAIFRYREKIKELE